VTHEAFAAAAVAWALARIGDRTYGLRCLAFVEDAYERGNRIEVFGGASATESAELYGLEPYESDDPPPAGSLVFYSAEGPIGDDHRDWGHVGLALGDGRVVHAWDEVRVDRAEDVEALAPAPGWTQPRLSGWTGMDRLLAGHRPRHWDDA
jgi:hypothetical protein